MSLSEKKLALARMVKYCEEEAAGMELQFVAYCLSLATGALAEDVDDGLIEWDQVVRLGSRRRD